MIALRQLSTSLFLVGTLAVGAVACGSSSDSSGSDTSTAAWCDKYEEFENSESEADMAGLTDMVDSLAKDAPKEIKSDMELLSSAFTDAMDMVDPTDSDAVAAFEEKYSDDEIEAATDRIEVFVKDVCGFDIDSD